MSDRGAGHGFHDRLFIYSVGSFWCIGGGAVLMWVLEEARKTWARRVQANAALGLGNRP